MTDPKPNTLVEVTISAPIDTVWKAVRDPEQITQWFGWESDTLAEEITLIFGSPDVVDVQERKLKFGEWEGIADGFELIERGDSTLLRVVRFGALPESWDEIYSGVREGWMTFVQQLRLWIERHHGQQRRTIYLSDPTPEDGQPLSTALGLRALWDVKPDVSSLVTLPTQSQTVSASYRTGFQLGLHVPGWGDGMLVVTDMPADAEKPARGSLLITTFGMEDQAASEFAQRWIQWWEGRHPPASA